jgi:hypothetical protein
MVSFGDIYLCSFRDVVHLVVLGVGVHGHVGVFHHVVGAEAAGLGKHAVQEGGRGHLGDNLKDSVLFSHSS